MRATYKRRIIKLAVITSLAVSMIHLELQGQSFPAHASKDQSFWEGDVTAPRWIDHVRLLLVRDGTILSGWMWRSSPANGIPDQMIGEINSSSELRMRTESGLIYIGKFADTGTMMGVRPNGDENDQAIPRFPFQFKRIRDADESDFPPRLPPTSSDWKVFIAQFAQAVQQRNRLALEKLMSRRFQLDYRHSPVPGDELNGVDVGFWSALSRAISHGAEPRPGKKSPFVLEQRVAFTCTKCTDQGNVDFTKGLDGQWRWDGLFYPG
jgi:hypothetical protein